MFDPVTHDEAIDEIEAGANGDREMKRRFVPAGGEDRVRIGLGPARRPQGEFTDVFQDRLHLGIDGGAVDVLQQAFENLQRSAEVLRRHHVVLITI